MNPSFVAHPDHEFRIGDFLRDGFRDDRWTEFRAAVAFVKRSGTKHIREDLAKFHAKGHTVKITAGIDAGGTSSEGLADLIEATQGSGSLFAFKNANSSTFHPKVYLFANAEEAEVVVGSGNLTEGGLFTNYEASLKTKLNLKSEADAALYNAILTTLNVWSQPVDGLCYILTEELLKRLVAEGFVPNELQIQSTSGKGRAPASEQSLFARHAVRAAPMVKSADALDEPEDEPEDDSGLEVPVSPPVAAQPGLNTVFLMTLQKTDVGVGQTSEGTTRRSPEIFIPLAARNMDPLFWGWPDQFVTDLKWTKAKDGEGRGKMDRADVMVRIGGSVIPVHLWYNPLKRDLRLRSESLRTAGSIGDILYIERSTGEAGFSYYVDIVPVGSPKHVDYLARCDNKVRNSLKVFGYL